METLDIAARTARPTEALVVVGIDQVASLMQGPDQVTIAPTMFTEPVEDEDDAARLALRTPAAVEDGQSALAAKVAGRMLATSIWKW